MSLGGENRPHVTTLKRTENNHDGNLGFVINGDNRLYHLEFDGK